MVRRLLSLEAGRRSRSKKGQFSILNEETEEVEEEEEDGGGEGVGDIRAMKRDKNEGTDSGGR